MGYRFGEYYAVYESDILPRHRHPGLQKWWNQGIDHVDELVRESRSRNLEVFWSTRVCPVDSPQPWEEGCSLTDEKRMNPLKQEHLDWTVRCWWWQGLWNLASDGFRSHEVAVLREIAEKYDFHGLQLDFARHMPCLPLGRQWELRDHATTFVRMIREMLLDVEQRKGSPVLLAVKVPENIEGCHIDGLDVERWAREELIDIFVLGGSNFYRRYRRFS